MVIVPDQSSWNRYKGKFTSRRWLLRCYTGSFDVREGKHQDYENRCWPCIDVNRSRRISRDPAWISLATCFDPFWSTKSAKTVRANQIQIIESNKYRTRRKRVVGAKIHQKPSRTDIIESNEEFHKQTDAFGLTMYLLKIQLGKDHTAIFKPEDICNSYVDSNQIVFIKSPTHSFHDPVF